MKPAIPIFCLALAGCQALTGPEAPDGRLLFQDNCAQCHGDDARGDGPMAAHLLTPAPDLTRLSRDNGGVFPRDRVMSMIDGYQRDGHISAAMPEFGAGDLGDLIIVDDGAGHGEPVPERLLALTEYLHRLQAP